MTIIISSAPEHIGAVKSIGRPLLHMAYSFGSPFPENPELSGGMMAIYGDIKSSHSVDIVRLCRQQGYSGVVAGYGYCSILETMRLAEALGRRGIRLYLIEDNYCSDCGAYAVVSTAISGGDLKSRLKEAIKRYGASRIALDFQRLSNAFPLPSPDGNGNLIEPDELNKYISIAETPVSISEDLCCKYFSYSDNGFSRFVLFDDIETLKIKIKLAESLGIKEGFVMYPEWDEDSLRLLPGSPSRGAVTAGD